MSSKGKENERADVDIRGSHQLGELVQSYIDSRWGHRADARLAASLGTRLGPSIRGRLEALGIDTDRLLFVRPQDVMDALDRLERQTVEEDIGTLRRDRLR